MSRAGAISRNTCALVSILWFGNASAHMPYVLPNFFDVGKRDHVTVQASFTEEFFQPDVVMKADDWHVVAPDGSKHPIDPVYAKDLAVIEVPTPCDGTYRISTGVRTGRVARAAWVSDDWKFLDRDEAPPQDSKAYDVTSVTTAEVYVTRGSPDDRALRAANSGLEFRPITHPSSLFVASEVKFAVLFDGKPLSDQSVSVYRDGARYADKKTLAEVKTDAAGVFAITPDRPGVYVAITRYRPAPTADSTRGVSYTYSVVFEATD